MSTFPSVISTISTPTATDKLNSPSHSSIEAGQNDAISKLETFVGTLSSTAGTLIYDIRATASDGGGHVQGANKGGTGQTSYTKGNVLVASSASVLSKVAIGSNNQVLTADSGESSGVKWAGVANAEAIQNQQYTYARASVHSDSVYGVVLNDAVSVLSDGLGLVVKFPAANAGAAALTVNATGPTSVTALIKNTAIGDLAANEIKASMIGILEFDSVSSVFQMQPNKGYTDNNVTSIYSGVDTKISTRVATTGNESIDGVKTFTSSPIAPTPTTSVQVAIKGYVDANTGQKVNITTTDQSYVNSDTNETTWFSISIPANTLGTGDGVKLKAFVDYIIAGSDTGTKQFKLKYGSTTIYDSGAISQTGNSGTYSGYLDILLLGAGATNSQEGSMSMRLSNNISGDITHFVHVAGDGTASEDSTGALNLLMTVQDGAGNSGTSILGRHITVEKIK